MNISGIPLRELMTDLKEAAEDVIVCQNALDAGVTSYSSGSVLSRLISNLKQIEVIQAELRRRLDDKCE